MSRRELINAANRIGVRTDAVRGGKRGAKDNQWLRMNLLESTYGAGLAWEFPSAAAADATCVRAVASRMGDLGHPLSVAQACIREGNGALVEYRRLCGLQRRRPRDEANALRVAREMFGKARTTQDEWSNRASVQR
jgi:hypothetical protein